jgi:hypothetical protein
MDFYQGLSSTIDLREELHAVLWGRFPEPGQGQCVVFRRLTNTHCPGCWSDKTSGSTLPNCKYCQGEGYQFYEREELIGFFRGAAPVYKGGVLATGQYPQMGTGYTDVNKATGYIEVMRPDGTETYPDYERYLIQDKKSYDRMYELKVDIEGNVVRNSAGIPTRTAKWKILNVIPLRGDYGRIEFFELALEKINI